MGQNKVNAFRRRSAPVVGETAAVVAGEAGAAVVAGVEDGSPDSLCYRDLDSDPSGQRDLSKAITWGFH